MHVYNRCDDAKATGPNITTTGGDILLNKRLLRP
jgi:hypothetical protein